jgi:hypothetical protein
MDTKCVGVSLRGYRRGESCGAVAKYDARGKRYCASHYVVALKEPKRFREALEAYVRGEARREAARRATLAQIDAFPIEVSSDDNPS